MSTTTPSPTPTTATSPIPVGSPVAMGSTSTPLPNPHLKKKQPSIPAAVPSTDEGTTMSLEQVLVESNYPENLIRRLLKDANGGVDYTRLQSVHQLQRLDTQGMDVDFTQIPSLAHLKSTPVPGYEVRRLQHPLDLKSKQCPELTKLDSVVNVPARAPNRGYCGYMLSPCCCFTTASVPPGHFGVLQDEEDYELLAPGYHSRTVCGTMFHNVVDATQINTATVYGPSGFVVVGEGTVGNFKVGLTNTLVPQGTYCWEDPTVKFTNSVPMKVDTAIVAGAAGFVMIGEGSIGVMRVDTSYQFLLHGIYEWHNPLMKFHSVVKYEVDKAMTFGASGFVVISEGKIGIVQIKSNVVFLDQGTYQWSSASVEFIGIREIEVDKVVSYGAAGFVTISEGRIGVMQVGSDFRILPQGTYQWSSPAVKFQGLISITGEKACVKLGPYSVVTVPDGEVAVTYNNGVLQVLRSNVEEGNNCSMYFLDNPKWTFREMITLTMQTDHLEGNNLLSKDNVELLMAAMSQWRIFDPVLAITHCAAKMSEIRATVNDLIRATIARIVAGTCIGAGPVGAVSAPPVMGQAVGDAATNNVSMPAAPPDEMGLAQLMQSDHASKHMGELSANLRAMGVDVIGVFVPEKRMKNDDIRREIAKQAVIGIKADAERAAADAKAYATVKSAFAEAEAIQVVARAHAEAGKLLGDPTSTASRLALTETTAKALEGSKMTIFSGGPKDMPFLLSAPPSNDEPTASRIAPA